MAKRGGMMEGVNYGGVKEKPLQISPRKIIAAAHLLIESRESSCDLIVRGEFVEGARKAASEAGWRASEGRGTSLGPVAAINFL
jgi:hypothetical protein